MSAPSTAPRPPACHPAEESDGRALAREVASRPFVLLKNNPAPDGGAVLPLDRDALRRVAPIGDAARHARVMDGGSATVFPEHDWIGRSQEEIEQARRDWMEGSRFGEMKGYAGAPLPARNCHRCC